MASIFEGRIRRLSDEGPRYACRRSADCSVALPHVAAREAYLAVFHAAEAYIFEQTDKVAKTHRGVRSEFSRPARAEVRIGRDLITFLGTADQFKTRADYAVGSTATPITPAEATAAIATTARFIDTITQGLPPGLMPPHGPSAQP
ncbi:MAG TPA: HEPN domain-containing protein [Acetobacteraceae bacterium]|nr:HEPN domain-containing protein [Acetobacteraceae bacterium]